MTRAIPPGVREALEAGNKLEAFKLLRSATGIGLKEVKEWLDAYQRGAAPPLPESNMADAQTPAGNRTLSQDAVQKQSKGKGVPARVAPAPYRPVRRPGLSPGEVPRGGSSGNWVVLIGLAALGILVAHFLGYLRA